MFEKMGIPGLDGLMGKNNKINFSAMQGHITKNTRMAKQRDRMRAKLAAKRETGKDEQIKILQAQLEAARQTSGVLETIEKKKPKRKKKRRRGRKKK